MNAKTSPPHRVLVTGASGAVGTPICRHLLGRGHHARGLYHVCAAAVTAGVQRLVIASSLQVIIGLGKKGLIRVEDGAAPTNHYALTKVWAEDLGESTPACTRFRWS